jgi:nicotinamide-nucleotide amidase
MVGARLTEVPGASRWFRGSVVAYAPDVKYSVLGVPEGPVVSEDAATAMAVGAARVLGASVGLGVTGVAGPDPQDDQPIGTVWCGAFLDGKSETLRVQLPGDRQRIREYATITRLDMLRRRLLDSGG